METNDFRFIKPGEIRTRYAPSPTGFLHIGGTRTAFFNYLFTKKYKGTFILRIEDTDLERSNPRFEKDILESLKWLGIRWDEGPIKVNSPLYLGDYGPYRQSEKLSVYTRYLEKLLKDGNAYYCFCTKEELETQRQYQMSQGLPPRYSGKCTNLSPRVVKKYLAEGKSYIIRFRVPKKKIEFNDLIRGHLEFDTSLIGDIAIAKNLATPLYNFAVVVDDFEMKITHVVRGEDHIPNTPKQILIQEALNFPRPNYVHLPLILGPDKSKLSKRHGAVSILEYRKRGYLPETLINFMAFLGWNPGTKREIFSLPSLIKEFSLEKIQKGGAIFDIKKLDWLNGFYIRQRSLDKLTELCLPYLIKAGFIEKTSKAKMFKMKRTEKIISFDYLKKIISIYQGRLKKLSEISELTNFFFRKKIEYDKSLLVWEEMSDKEVKKALDKSRKMLLKIEKKDWKRKNLEDYLFLEADKFAKKLKRLVGNRGYLLWPLRVALTGKEASASPFEIAEILGKEETIKRIKEAEKLL